ncbi:hypothetical protein LBMAG42_54030 [Deltaproteobacteria bacterium]|nr:hypothetical protein LBMAG42_54030 [Deltaproteobacteria bacterium]
MSRGRRLGLGLGVAALLLGAAEAWFQAHPPPSVLDTPEAAGGDETLMNGNPWLLWELLPGDHLERGGHVHVNATGFRDRERGPKSRPRVVALGDSSVYGFGNDDGDVFTSRLEAQLPADFINAAVPGYSSFQALNALRGRVLALEPDVLLVATLWSDNNFDSFVDKDLLASYAGWEETPLARLRAVLSASALFRALDWELRVKPAGARARSVGWQVGGTDARTGTRRVAIADYAANLESFCHIMAARGGGVVFVLLANREDLSPVSADPAWAPYRDVMRGAATRCQSPLVDVPAAYRASGKSADALFLDLMHPTARGHSVLAEAVAATLEGAGWPEQPLRVVAPSGSPIAPIDRFEGHGTIKEAAGVRPESVALELELPPTPSALIVDIRDADGPTAAALGSIGVAAGEASDGLVRVVLQLSRRPANVRVGLTVDGAGDGPGSGDQRQVSAPLSLSAETLHARFP